MIRPIRAVLAAAVTVCGLAPCWSTAGSERDVLLEHAEAALARGDSSLAAETFERAASTQHAPDTEMGIVRTAMQQGRYAQALAFAAHTAGAHLEAAPASALYAWLLRVGGQSAISDRVLAEALARAPDDAVLRAARTAFASPGPLAEGVLLDVPQRMAPPSRAVAGQDALLPASVSVACSGVLVAQGTQAIVPVAVAARTVGTRLWLRNGLGLTVTGTLVRDDDAALAAAGLARVQLDRTLPFEAGDTPTLAPLPAGRPAFAIEYVTGRGNAAAWPWLTQGFIGSMSSDGARRLGIVLGQGSHGGPVLDGEGRLAGIAVARSDGAVVFVPAAAWQPGDAEALAAGPPERVLAVASPAPAMRAVVPATEAYERALRLALQVIAVLSDPNVGGFAPAALGGVYGQLSVAPGEGTPGNELYAGRRGTVRPMAQRIQAKYASAELDRPRGRHAQRVLTD